MKIKKVSECIGIEVFTDAGERFGQVEEANLVDNKIDGWRIRIGGGIGSLLGGARGVIIPHHFVKAVGDIFVISNSAIPTNSGAFGQELSDEIESV